MPSRVSSTSEPTASWKTWILQEFARYWYGLGVLALLVFGGVEVARLAAPLDSLEVIGLLLLGIAIIALGLVGYVMLWRRHTEGGQWVLGVLSRLRSIQRTSAATHPQGATTKGDPDAEISKGRA